MIYHHPLPAPPQSQVLVEVARSLGIKCHARGTMLTIEGPRFSSRAESLMFRQWGADVINMTTVPEVVLAKEAGLCYASIALATDYDCWKEHAEAVSERRLFHGKGFGHGDVADAGGVAGLAVVEGPAEQCRYRILGSPPQMMIRIRGHRGHWSAAGQ
ncbi:hypothetical protein CRUP_033438 [Coryphaenoides rupestris]|nr:hypothetical protein CRUP_033438 [Coryphaenoides rupestris]